MAIKDTLNDLFPTRLSFLVFILYIALFVNQGLLVTASQRVNNSYEYNITIAVLLSELIKLAASVVLFSLQAPCTSMITETRKHLKVAWLYCLPAALYCLYNNLSYVNLKTFDPTTYFILLQLRVLITAVIFQVIFKKGLSKKQWMSLLILTVGCMVKQIHFSDETVKKSNTNDKQLEITLSTSTLLIFVQVICSCLAGVYNEYLLKYQGVEVNIYLQNAFMYFDSILCNILFMFVTSDISTLLTTSTFTNFLNFKVILVIVNNATLGIVTSFFLKSLNSILKNFASALELIFTAIFSLLFFSIPIHLNTALSITLIIVASVIYCQNPVKNQSPVKIVGEKLTALV